MPVTGAALRTQLADRGLNPSRTVAPAVGSATGGQKVHVDIVFQGVAVNPEDIYDALVAKYGAGKVSSDKDVTAHNVLQFRIIP